MINPDNGKIFFDFINNLPNETRLKLFDPSAEAIGKGVGAVFDLIFYPLNKLKIYDDAKLEKYAQDIGTKLSTIPEKNRDSSKLDLTLKSAELSKYAINDNDIQHLFAQLITNTVDNRKNRNINKLFPSILSNFSSDDAKFMNNFRIVHTNDFPIAKIFREDNELKIRNIQDDNLVDFNNDKDIKSFSKEIDFLTSYNLINVSYETTMFGSNTYNKLDAYLKEKKDQLNIERIQLDEKRKNNNNSKIEYADLSNDYLHMVKGIVSMTSLGISFLTAITK